MIVLSRERQMAIALGEATDSRTSCVNPGTTVSAQLHRIRAEPLCDPCEANARAAWAEALELERFGHGETRRALVAKVRREGSRLVAEKNYALHAERHAYCRDVEANMRNDDRVLQIAITAQNRSTR